MDSAPGKPAAAAGTLQSDALQAASHCQTASASSASASASFLATSSMLLPPFPPPSVAEMKAKMAAPLFSASSSSQASSPFPSIGRSLTAHLQQLAVEGKEEDDRRLAPCPVELNLQPAASPPSSSAAASHELSVPPPQSLLTASSSLSSHSSVSSASSSALLASPSQLVVDHSRLPLFRRTSSIESTASQHFSSSETMYDEIDQTIESQLKMEQEEAVRPPAMPALAHRLSASVHTIQSNFKAFDDEQKLPTRSMPTHLSRTHSMPEPQPPVAHVAPTSHSATDRASPFGLKLASSAPSAHPSLPHTPPSESLPPVPSASSPPGPGPSGNLALSSSISWSIGEAIPFPYSLVSPAVPLSTHHHTFSHSSDDQSDDLPPPIGSLSSASSSVRNAANSLSRLNSSSDGLDGFFDTDPLSSLRLSSHPDLHALEVDPMWAPPPTRAPSLIRQNGAYRAGTSRALTMPANMRHRWQTEMALEVRAREAQWQQQQGRLNMGSDRHRSRHPGEFEHKSDELLSIHGRENSNELADTPNSANFSSTSLFQSPTRALPNSLLSSVSFDSSPSASSLPPPSPEQDLQGVSLPRAALADSNAAPHQQQRMMFAALPLALSSPHSAPDSRLNPLSASPAAADDDSSSNASTPSINTNSARSSRRQHQPSADSDDLPPL